MNLFIGHTITRNKDGFMLVLYLNPQHTEFADELSGIGKRYVEQTIKDYIVSNFPNLKIKSVNIMLGSLLIATLPFSSINAAADTTSSHQLQLEQFYEYTVKSGDSLFKIANEFETTIARLMSINGLSGDLIYVGQQLKVPSPQPDTYLVRAGDTLFIIANQFGLTVHQLKTYNELDNDMIYVGQILRIPVKKLIETVNRLPDGVFHVGSKGESVRGIQKGLNTFGYDLEDDGIYGPITRSVIFDFQSQYNNLTNDGVYGPNTKRYLQNALLTDHIVAPNPASTLVLINKKHSLPSDYIPDNLVVPNVSFPFEEYNPKKLMRQDAAWAIEQLFQKADQDNISLYALSGYRSYNRQKAIFGSNVKEHGMAVANQTSAKPGESEHQTGLAMDLTSPSVNLQLSQYFGQTREGRWLKQNAPDFGFIIRYPSGKEEITGYQYEPWHIRYVGTPAALDISHNNLTLEEYLGVH